MTEETTNTIICAECKETIKIFVDAYWLDDSDMASLKLYHTDCREQPATNTEPKVKPPIMEFPDND